MIGGVGEGFGGGGGWFGRGALRRRAGGWVRVVDPYRLVWFVVGARVRRLRLLAGPGTR